MKHRPSVPSLVVDDPQWSVLERVAASATFRRSPKSRELLLFICEHALQNRTEELHEQHIGCGVFGRQSNYNPGEDNIVRVQMRQLRKRLEKYFAAEGKDEPYLIVVPKGSYVPVIEPRETEAPAEHSIRRWRRFAQPAAIVILAVACLWMWLGRRPVDTAAYRDTAMDRGALWPLVFNAERRTVVETADSGLVVAETLLGRPVGLDEYLSRDYVGDLSKQGGPVRSLLPGMTTWRYTDIADVKVVQRVFALNWEYWDKVTVQSARNAQFEDFKNNNVLLLGSVRSNPWGHLFDAVLNFHFDQDPESHSCLIVNRAPRAGEQALYRSARPGGTGETYSVLALAPNLRRTGSVFLIAGATAESTEATGEYVTNPAASAALFARLMHDNHGRMPYFEVLLKLSALDGVARDPQVAAIRLLPEEASEQKEEAAPTTQQAPASSPSSTPSP